MQRRCAFILAVTCIGACSSDALTGTSGRQWVVQNSGTTQMLLGIWGSSATDVFAVGQRGTIVHYDGTAWSAQSSGTTTDLLGVWGSSSTDVFAIGAPLLNAGRLETIILHYDGSRWSRQGTGAAPSYLLAVGGTSPADVFASGALVGITVATILRYDGTAWRAETLYDMPAFGALWSTSPTNVIAVGNGLYGSVWRYNGSSWVADYRGPAELSLTDVWGSAANNIFVAGAVASNPEGYPTGRVLHYDGARWATMAGTAVGQHSALFGIWGASSSDVFAVGYEGGAGGSYQGTMLHYNGLRWSREAIGTVGNLLAVWGTGSIVFAVGVGGLIVRGSP